MSFGEELLEIFICSQFYFLRFRDQVRCFLDPLTSLSLDDLTLSLSLNSKIDLGSPRV